MSDLRTAAQQALEALEAYLSDELRPYEAAKTADALRAALAETAKRKMNNLLCHAEDIGAYFATPPQRKPLTDEEILAAVGWERAEMYMKLVPNFPVDEAKQETLKNARAVERAVRGVW